MSIKIKLDRIKAEKPKSARNKARPNDSNTSTSKSLWLKLNKFLYPALFFVGIYLIIWPFIGEILFPIQQFIDTTDGFDYQSQLLSPELNEGKDAIPKENVLIIPQIGINAEIFDGTDESTLDLGIWRRPHTSTPGEGGNTVLTAHRFLYRSGPNTFYHLNKLELGDTFIVYWEGEEYDYEVTDIRKVHETQINVEDQTEESIVTLYTCSGFDAKDRLVITGNLLESDSTAQTNE